MRVCIVIHTHIQVETSICMDKCTFASLEKQLNDGRSGIGSASGERAILFFFFLYKPGGGDGRRYESTFYGVFFSILFKK